MDQFQAKLKTERIRNEPNDKECLIRNIMRVDDTHGPSEHKIKLLDEASNKRSGSMKKTRFSAHVCLSII